MDFYQTYVPQMTKMLNNLGVWLDEAEKLAKGKEFPVEQLLQMRLVADQFSLMRQLQSAADTAKFATARVAGKEAPSFPDDEATLPEIRERLKKTVAFLDTIEASDINGKEEALIRLPFLPEGKGARAADYIHEFVLPNFYFHITTAYAILRANGVALGKRTYLGNMPIIDVP